MRHLLATLVLSISSPGLHAAQPQPGDGLWLDIAEATAVEVEAYKQAAGVSWWIEAGPLLLLVGQADVMQAALPAARRLELIGRLDPAGLALHARGCNERVRQPDAETLLLPLETHDLLRAAPVFSPLGQKTLDPALGAPAWEAVAPNSVIARMRRLDREGRGNQADPGIVPIVAAVDPARWFATVVDLAAFDRSSYAPTLPAARQWILARLAELGLSTSEPGFAFPHWTPAPLANVAGFWTGTHEPEQWIVVGAHYDSRNEVNSAASWQQTPGADDNASGCAGVIEAARAILPFRPRRSIVFICYAGEEQGLYGSIGHVDALSASGDLARVQAMLNMDMIGWSPNATLGVNIEVRTSVGNAAANLALANLLADAALDYVPAFTPSQVLVRTTTCCSDHMPYLNAGLPAALSIHRGTTSYPHYHRTTDTPANLGPHAQAIGAAIVRMNVAALAQLAGASDRVFASGLE